MRRLKQTQDKKQLMQEHKARSHKGTKIIGTLLKVVATSLKCQV